MHCADEDTELGTGPTLPALLARLFLYPLLHTPEPSPRPAPPAPPGPPGRPAPPAPAPDPSPTPPDPGPAPSPGQPPDSPPPVWGRR